MRCRHGKFLFRSSLTGRYVDVRTPPIFANSPPREIEFTWPFAEVWDQFAGLINGDNCPIYWQWRGEDGSWIPTPNFPREFVAMYKP